jgi:hypothetical protein
VFDDQRRTQLRELLHQSPRSFGESTSIWTLALAAKVADAQGITPRLVSDETIRAALTALQVSWQRAKHWITSPAHVMVIVPHKLDPARYSTDHHSDGPYVMWAGTPYEHIMMPIK